MIPEGTFYKTKTVLLLGGRIDNAHHETKAYLALADTEALHLAVEKAVEMTDEEDTLIAVTADHSHVFTMGGYTKLTSDILGMFSMGGCNKLTSDILNQICRVSNTH